MMIWRKPETNKRSYSAHGNAGFSAGIFMSAKVMKRLLNKHFLRSIEA